MFFVSIRNILCFVVKYLGFQMEMRMDVSNKGAAVHVRNPLVVRLKNAVSGSIRRRNRRNYGRDRRRRNRYNRCNLRCMTDEAPVR